VSGEAALARLAAHFDECAGQGAPRPVWWRDDDATRQGPRLDALLALAGLHAAPLALAVIPDGSNPALLGECARRGIAVLQHGVCHADHEPDGGKAELGPARPIHVIVADLLAARRHLEGPAFLPVLVPPWNRMREDLAPALAAAGYAGVSRFGGGLDEGPPRRVDTHIDPVGWRTGRSLADDGALDAMAARAVAVAGPLGLLTHHIVHDGAVAGLVERLAALVARHPGARWAAAAEVFPVSP